VNERRTTPGGVEEVPRPARRRWSGNRGSRACVKSTTILLRCCSYRSAA